MSALVTTLLVIPALVLLAIVGWRLGYVSGYEAKTRDPRMGYSWQTPESIARNRGILCAAIAPIAVPALLVARYLTPVPPSLAAKHLEERRREQDRYIARLEREAGIR